MSWFSQKQSAVLGIDISTAAIKLLELSKVGARYRVESYAVAPLPQDAVIDKNIANIEVIADAIKIALKQSGSKLKQASVAVAGSSVMTKVIPMPASLTDDEMEEQIMVEADQYVPYSLDEVNFDFEVQGENENNPEMVNVLLAASRKEIIEDRVEVLAKAGLKAKIVDVEAFAMENAFSLLIDQLPDAVEGQTVAIVDIGATMTALNVLYNCRTVYTREQGFGGKQLTEEIQRRYGLTYERPAWQKNWADCRTIIPLMCLSRLSGQWFSKFSGRYSFLFHQARIDVSIVLFWRVVAHQYPASINWFNKL